MYFRVYYWSSTLRGFLHEGQFNLCVVLDTAYTGSESWFFWEYSCFESDEKGSKNAIMLVKWSFWEQCIIPACELLVVWFSIRINKRWKMTRSCWLCASFITELLLSEALCKQLDRRGRSLNCEVFPLCYHWTLAASQSLPAPVATDPVPVLGHLLEIHLSLLNQIKLFLGICFLSSRFLSC